MIDGKVNGSLFNIMCSVLFTVPVVQGYTFAYFTTPFQKDLGTVPSKEGIINSETQSAIDLGLSYLAARQHSDGSFGSGNYHHNVAVTSLSAMAMMSAGNTPGRGKYGQNVNRAIDFVLSRTGADGFVCDPTSTSHGPMYDHGFGLSLIHI